MMKEKMREMMISLYGDNLRTFGMVVDAIVMVIALASIFNVVTDGFLAVPTIAAGLLHIIFGVKKRKKLNLWLFHIYLGCSMMFSALHILLGA